MAAVKKNFDVDAFAYFQIPFQCLKSDGSPLDVTPYLFAGEARIKYEDSTPVAVFTLSVTSAVDGLVLAEMHASETAKLNSYDAVYYDIKGTQKDNTYAGHDFRILYGELKIKKGVTR